MVYRSASDQRAQPGRYGSLYLLTFLAGFIAEPMSVAIAVSTDGVTLPAACASLRDQGPVADDATGLFQKCLDALPERARLTLPAQVYTLKQQLFVRKPVAISTEHDGKAPPNCGDGKPSSCLTFRLRPDQTFAAHGPKGLTTRPIVVSAPNITLDHVAIDGFKNESNRAAVCNAAGGSGHANGVIGIAGDSFTLTYSAITGSPCNGAISVLAGNKGLELRRNLIAYNGSHTQPHLWADGATVLDAEKATIEGNTFRDNTDVQLVVGGCRDCSIRSNRFVHSPDPDAGAYADLMLAGWPNTSGDFSGTTVEKNTIDCGSTRNCGFAIMYGGRPWYNSNTSGGVIRDNSVVNAKLAININDATGPVAFMHNTVKGAGGTYSAACGTVAVGAVNISKASQANVTGDLMANGAGASITNLDFFKCGLK